MKVLLSARAEKELKKLSKVHQIIVAKKIRTFYQNQLFSQEEKLKGFSNIFRIRVGNYRIVYQKTKERIYVILIAHRKDIYHLFTPTTTPTSSFS